MSSSLHQRARTALDRLRRELLEARVAEGHWVGQLSPSSLSTATAVSAIAANLLNTHSVGTDPQPQVSAARPQGDTSLDQGKSIDPATRQSCVSAVTQGINALSQQQNGDGGFGDTDRSYSNIATSYLVLAAATLAKRAVGVTLSDTQTSDLKSYLHNAGGFNALRERYGKDKTFVVPILTNLAIAGIVPWKDVPVLPFEAAAFPQSMYRLLQMPVVSYAIPALVAIGQTRHFHGPKAWLPIRLIRSGVVNRTMNVLRRMQPESGGYLEATPLTAFVIMSLAITGRGNHEVSRNGLRFLIDSMDKDGRWPIDTNLATWATSLSMHALACDPEDDGQWCSPELIRWHLSCQHRARHPFTGAEPGGWGWSDLSGAVPDSDDTPAAILALQEASRWQPKMIPEMKLAVRLGVQWLKKLQNSNGGWPTFCRGWGKLPFDRSSNDLTAHAVRALSAAERLGIKPNHSASQLTKAQRFLEKNQQSDGSWLPLWFGNQDREDESNPIYGTSKVLAAGVNFLDEKSIDHGCKYLCSTQNDDGGWGGGASLTNWLRTDNAISSACKNVKTDASTTITSSMEETALAVDALITVLARRNQNKNKSDNNQGNGNWNRLSITHQNPSPSAGESNKKQNVDEASATGTPLGRDEISAKKNAMTAEPNQANTLQTHDDQFQQKATGEATDQRNGNPSRSPKISDKGDADLDKAERLSVNTPPNTGGMGVKVSAETTENSETQSIDEESCTLPPVDAGKDALCESIILGVEFLVRGIETDRHHTAWPIGFYFAKLWYHEKLYPHIFTASALGKFLRTSAAPPRSTWPE